MPSNKKILSYKGILKKVWGGKYKGNKHSTKERKD